MNYYNLNADDRPYGVPLTEEQRTIRHKALTGETTPPIRGTRKAKVAKAGIENNTMFWILIAAQAGTLIGTLYLAYKQGLFTT